jgi:hypothetical protein
LNTTKLAGPSLKINDPVASDGSFQSKEMAAMADYQIDCVNKPDRNSQHDAITHVGGPNPNGSGRWKDTVPNVVKFIEAETHRFYTNVGGRVAWVGVNVSAAGNKYIQTHADGAWNNNLLVQNECG